MLKTTKIRELDSETLEYMKRLLSDKSATDLMIEEVKKQPKGKYLPTALIEKGLKVRLEQVEEELARRKENKEPN